MPALSEVAHNIIMIIPKNIAIKLFTETGVSSHAEKWGDDRLLHKLNSFKGTVDEYLDRPENEMMCRWFIAVLAANESGDVIEIGDDVELSDDEKGTAPETIDIPDDLNLDTNRGPKKGLQRTRMYWAGVALANLGTHEITQKHIDFVDANYRPTGKHKPNAIASKECLTKSLAALSGYNNKNDRAIFDDDQDARTEQAENGLRGFF